MFVTMTMMEILYGTSNPRESISLGAAWNFSDWGRRNLVKSTRSDKSFPVVTEKERGVSLSPSSVGNLAPRVAA